MKRSFVLVFALMMVLLVGTVAMADENPAGSVNFNVKWTVEPVIHFAIGYGENYVHYANGEAVVGDAAFTDYVFDTRAANYMQSWFGAEDIQGEDIWAIVDSNDWWVLEFNKPSLVSDNDQYTTVPVYAKRHLYDYYTDVRTSTDWFAGNDRIQMDKGVHDIVWEMKVQFENWNTRYGNYENVYSVTVTQF